MHLFFYYFVRLLCTLIANSTVNPVNQHINVPATASAKRTAIACFGHSVFVF